MSRPLRTAIAITLLITVAAATGCGGSDSEADEVGADAQKAAADAVIAKATPVANGVKDRYLKGPRKLRSRCTGVDSRPTEPGAQLRCRTTAYVRPQATYDDPSTPLSLSVVSETWIATVSESGKVSSVKIGRSGYEISQFFQDDDWNGCSAGKSLNC